MSYNMKELPNYIQTAGKITVITSLVGVAIFSAVFFLNVGVQKELQHVEAQGLATTSVTVLNTPPQWTIDAQEAAESSGTTPTNSGSTVTWTARATDSNGESYYLLICSNGNAPTANPSAAPTCGAGATRWALSAFTASGASSTAATTTTEAFAESNDWYAWVCDAVADNPRCNATAKQGSGSTASPFKVNHRPAFSAFTDNSPTLPGAIVTFSATASDADVDTANDTVRLFVCSTNSFNTASDTCTASTIASSTFAASNPSGTYTVVIPTQDQNYDAYGFVIDNHGHEATGGSQGTNSTLTVANATSTVSAAQIALNGGGNMTLSQESGQTTGFTLQYVVSDNNSCLNSASTPEITNYVVSVFRSGVGSSTCNGTAGSYDPNNCYPSGVATSTWNLSCTRDSATCSGNTDTSETWNCTFPLWYVADPTDGSATSTFYHAEDWRAGVSAIDDDNATSSFTMSSTPDIELLSFLSMALDSATINYSSLEPGQRTDPLIASTTVRATGNVGLDQLLTGHSMCPQYSRSVTCPNSSTSTIADYNQVFHTSSVSFGTATSAGHTLSSTTQKELEINSKKSTGTSTQAAGYTYWGINVPATLTLAGSYKGENTFYGKVSEPAEWY